MSARAAAVELDGLRTDALAGKPVAVLGFARSGTALARFLHDQGARVTVYDSRPASELEGSIEALDGRSVRLLLGPDVDPATALADQALVTTSPSISSAYPTTEPRLRSALGALESAGRVPVVSEIDLFLRLCPAVTIGVTGTKGKTTTSSLTADVLRRGDAPVLLGGNIGTPLIERVPDLTPQHRVVLELSELQLPTLSRGTQICVYTHVNADHLDRHGSVAAYRAAKRRLAELLPPDGTLILNADDPVSSAYAGLTPEGGELVWYGRDEPAAGEVGIQDGWLCARDASPAEESVAGVTRIVPVADLRIRGAHSVSNALAAASVGLVLGIEPAAIGEALAAFAGVEHRLEIVSEDDGVRFVNDSMGTQPDAVIAALRSFPRPLVLIAGGRAKDLGIDALAREVYERADAAVLIGESGPGLALAFRQAGLERVERAEDLAAAVRAAAAIARQLPAREEPATVLLSPAAASFDMFEDYAARGRAFKAAVAELTSAKPKPVEPIAAQSRGGGI